MKIKLPRGHVIEGTEEEIRRLIFEARFFEEEEDDGI